MRCYPAIILAIINYSLSYSQVPGILNDLDKSLGFENSIELSNWDDHVLNLIDPEREELKGLGFFNDIQVSEILDHISTHGPMLEVEELQLVPSLDLELIRKLKQIKKVKLSSFTRKTLPGILRESRNQLSIKWSRQLELSNSYDRDNHSNSRYRGDANAFLLRYLFDHENRLKIAMMIEKDPGEAYWYNGSFDHMSFYIQKQRKTGILKSFLIGDFNISYGQGLISNNSFNNGKARSILGVSKNNPFAKPNNSINENSYSRGLQSTLSLHKNWELNLFISSKNRDAIISTDSLEDQSLKYVSSLLQTGLHRSKIEIDRKKLIGIFSYGGQLKFIQDRISIGLNYLDHSFGLPLFLGSNSRLDNTQSLKHLRNTSIDFNLSHKKVFLFGEIAHSVSKLSMIAGLIISPDKHLNISFSFRSYHPDYRALDPNAFGESDQARNETGIHMILEYQINSKFKFSIATDNWAGSNQLDRPKFLRRSLDIFSMLEYKRSKSSMSYISYTHKIKPKSLSSYDHKLSDHPLQTLQRLRIHNSHSFGFGIELRNRIELCHYAHAFNSSRGILIYQDLIFRRTESPLSFTCRFAVYNTDDYSSRIYAYENSLLREFLIPSYWGTGTRLYFNLRYKLNTSNTLEVSYSKTYKRNVTEMGSGTELIKGNAINRLKAQYLIKF